MLGIDPLTIGSLMVLAAGGGGLKCDMPKPTEINVVPKSLQVRHDYSQDLAQLQRHHTDTINPHGFGGISMTQGLMRGGIKIAPKVTMKYVSYERQGAACAWYDAINIVLEIDPTIVIAKEVRADSCMHNAVLTHEMKHVMVDRKLVNKYAKQIGEKLSSELSSRGFKSGMIPIASTQSVMKRMQDTVMQIVEHEYRKMELERVDLQSAIDTKEEYDSVSAQCPAFKKSMERYVRQNR